MNSVVLVVYKHCEAFKMEKLKAPASFNFNEENLARSWKAWKSHFNFFLVATESDKKAEKVKTAMLLSCIGVKGREIYDTFTFADEETSQKLSNVLTEFENYCTPKKNLTILRHKFFTCKQKEGQSFNSFVTDLRRLCEDCEFDALKDSLVKDVIVLGVVDEKLRERMLRDSSLDLKKAIELGSADEESKKHSKELKEELIVAKVNTSKHLSSRPTEMEKKEFRCKFCGLSHRKGKCPAWNKTCFKCEEKGHLIKFCPNNRKKANEVTVEVKEVSRDEDDEDSEFFIEAVSCKNDSLDVNTVTEDWNILLKVSNRVINFKMDTGAQVNLLPVSEINKLRPRPKILSSSIKLSAYNGSDIKVMGKVNLKVKGANVEFIIVDERLKPILGLKACESLKLIKRIAAVNSEAPATTKKVKPFISEYAKCFEKKCDEFITRFEDCFDDIGCLDYIHHIEVKPGVKPSISYQRKIPLALKPRLKEELNRMQSLGVIEPVQTATDWVNALVIVEKPNKKLRICLDPRPLNKAIKREYQSMPTAEEIMSEMAGAKFFSKIDASSGYWQIRLDEESSNLTTFSTPFGRFKFTRLPFGIHSASEVFQGKVAEIIEGTEGARNYQDDIIVWGSTKEEHDDRLFEVLSKIKESGLKLNNKCIFRATKLEFLGHIISDDGIQADPNKIRAIMEMPIPANKKDLQRFLGMVNYLGKFIKNLAEVTAPLRKMMQKDVEFLLMESQLNAIDQIKKLLTTAPVLRYYDPSCPIRVRPDASSEGLGALLEQLEEGEWRPVAYASRALTDAEKRYAQIEKETLSIVFGVTRFHEYVYGRKFLVINDHAPLKAILEKSIVNSPPRIQRFLLRLQRYEFDFQHSPGKLMLVSDALSRAYLPDETQEISQEELAYQVHAVFNTLPISDKKLIKFQEETAADPVLQLLKKYTFEGWPVNKKLLDPRVAPYFQHQHDIVYHNGILLKGNRIIVPSSMQKEMKQLIHQGHFGIEICKTRARSCLYWPNLNKHIDDMIANCNTCLEFRNRQAPEPILDHDVPEGPWI